MVYVKTLLAGLMVGVLYAVLRVKAPAPPPVALLGLTGLLGIGLGERAATALGARLARRRRPAEASRPVGRRPQEASFPPEPMDARTHVHRYAHAHRDGDGAT